MSEQDDAPGGEHLSPKSSLSPFQKLFIRYFCISLFIFMGGCIAGYLTSQAEPAFGKALLKIFQDMISNEIISDNPPLLALQLFLNNLQACVLLFLGGAAFSLVTIFVLSFNGIVIGGILELVGGKEGGLVMFAAIIPHGIFELPAVLVSSSLGLMLGRAIFMELTGQADAAQSAVHLGKIFLKYVVPFIAFAAFIEAFITPAILHLVK